MSLPMHARDATEVAMALSVDPRRGLATGEAIRRSIHFGHNVIDAAGWVVVARVLCDGVEKVVRSADLVPGDVIVVGPGTSVPADARVVSAAGLIADESKLTGAAAPVAKSADVVADLAPLPDRRSMLYLGTRVIAGHATAIVTATGDATELAKIRKSI